MVFFTCNACGESLKKAQVDKHVNLCRGCQVLSCIDCGKDFWGNDYKNHNKCISEDQKYGGKSYEAKANKGDVKQQQWLQRVNEAMNKPGVSAKLKEVLRQVSTYDNVPRKKAKFQNWMRNSLKIMNTSLNEEVWDILAAADKVPDAHQQTNEDPHTPPEIKVDTSGKDEQNDQQDVKKLNKRERKEARRQKNRSNANAAENTPVHKPEEPQAGKKKIKVRKRKRDGNEEQNGHSAENGTSSKKTKVDGSTEVADLNMSEESNDQAVAKGKFNWKGNIKAVLRESPDQELPVKKLRKKVVGAYYSFTGDENFKTEEEVLALFSKKINNNPKFRVLKDRVRLIQ